MGLGGHLCGPIYSGNFRPTRTRASGPNSDGKGGDVLEEGRRLQLLINTVHSSLPITFYQDIDGFWHLTFGVSKLYFQDSGTRSSLTLCTMVLDQQIQPSILPHCHDLPHVLSSIFAILKKRFLEFANDCDAACASEAVWAGGFVRFSVSGLMQVLRYLCCLGRHKKQWHSLAWFFLLKIHTWYNDRRQSFTRVSFLMYLRKNGGASHTASSET